MCPTLDPHTHKLPHSHTILGVNEISRAYVPLISLIHITPEYAHLEDFPLNVRRSSFAAGCSDPNSRLKRMTNNQ